jgi:hypothetical protein
VEKCPPEFDTCSLILSTVKFAHLQTVAPGDLRKEVFESTDKIGESVSAYSDFEVEYVGDSFVEEDYIITLRGIPPGSTMNTLQQRYFERITTDFLAEFAEISIYHVKVIQLEGAGEDVAEDSDGERLLSLGLRGTRRLQSEGELLVVTTVSGGGSSLDLQTNVLDTILNNTDIYVKELSLQQLRPGEINEGDSGALFESLQGVGVVLKPADFGALDDAVSGGGTGKSNVWLYLCIAGIAVSVIFLAYRIYRDTCYSPKENQWKLPRLISGKKPEEDNAASGCDRPDPRSLHHPGVPPSQSRLSLDGPQNKIPSCDGNSAYSIEPILDGNRKPSLCMASMQNTRPRPPKSRAQKSQSDRGPLQPSKPKSSNLRPKSSPYLQSGSINAPNRKPPPRNHSNDSPGPRARAGENGRGVRPTKSLPPPSKPKSSPNLQSGSINAPNQKPPASNHSNDSPGPSTRAGENGRGVSPTKSMSQPSKPKSSPHLQSRSYNEPDRKPPARNNSNDSPGPSTRAGKNGRGVRPTKSMPQSSKPKSIPQLQSRSNNAPKRKPPARNNSNDSPGPRTRAGENGRGVRSTKSMPQSSKPKSSPYHQSGSNNDPDRKPPARSNSNDNPGPRTRADENLRGVRPTRSIPQPSKPKSSPHLQSWSNSAPKRKPPARNNSNDSPGPRTRAGENGRGVRPTKSMPTPLMRPESRLVISKESQMSKKYTASLKYQSGISGPDIGANRTLPTYQPKVQKCTFEEEEEEGTTEVICVQEPVR